MTMTKLTTVAVLSALLIAQPSVEASAVASLPKRRKLFGGARAARSQPLHEEWIPKDWVDQTIPRGGADVAAAVSAGSSALFGTDISVIQTIGMAAVVAAVTCKKCAAQVIDVAKGQADNAKYLLAGAVAGVVSKTVISPLEVVSTLQMVNANGAAVKQSLLGQLGTLYQQEGMTGFFKGNLANCLKVAPTRAIQFFVFEGLKTKLMEYKLRQKTKQVQAAAALAAASAVITEEGSEGVDEATTAAPLAPIEVTLTPVERLVAGGLAGMFASSLVYPLEVVKTVLTLNPGQSIPMVFRQVVQTAGVKGLYAGLKPTLIAMFPYVGVEFMIYETSKIALEKFLAKNEDGTSMATVALPVVFSLALGAMAGAAAQTAAHPFDVIRKRMQVQSLGSAETLYKSSRHCFGKIVTTEGWTSLYKGLGPACIATLPGTGAAYLTYELMKQWLNLNSV